MSSSSSSSGDSRRPRCYAESTKSDDDVQRRRPTADRAAFHWERETSEQTASTSRWRGRSGTLSPDSTPSSVGSDDVAPFHKDPEWSDEQSASYERRILSPDSTPSSVGSDDVAAFHREPEWSDEQRASYERRILSPDSMPSSVGSDDVAAFHREPEWSDGQSASYERQILSPDSTPSSVGSDDVAAFHREPEWSDEQRASYERRILSPDSMSSSVGSDDVAAFHREPEWSDEQSASYERRILSPDTTPSSVGSDDVAAFHREPESSERRASDEGKPGRARKRRNFCPYCKTLFSNFSRHLVTKHGDENDVKDYVALSRASPRTRRTERAVITDRIRHAGNKMYNMSIVESRTDDDFLPAKRSSSRGATNLTHVCCKHCSGFFRKRSLYRHLKNCKQYDAAAAATGRTKRRVLAEHAGLVVRHNESAKQSLRTEVFPKMQKDEQTVVAQSDSLICRYGSDFRFTHRGTKQIHYCSSRMRSLARLYLTMRSLKPDIGEFSDCIASKHFDLLVESVRQMSKFDADSGHTRAPSVPPRLCSSLKRCANILKSEAVKSDSLSRREKTEIVCEMNDFLHLMDKDWATEVGTVSENSRKRMKVVKRDLLPDPDDIITFNAYIHGLCPRYVSDLKLVPTVKNYERLAKLVIAHIITLNRRRPNETAEITIEAYRSTLNERTDYGHDAQTAVTEEELESGSKLVIFYVAGNKNLKKVPVLLTEAFHRAVETLIESHEKLGIKSKFIFARPGANGGNAELFDGSAVLREIAYKAKLKTPSTFTANALRHHAATSSQLQSRDDTYAKRLSKFMGHDLRTHEHYYEMPLPLVQKTIVGHQLLKMVLPKKSSATTSTAAAGTRFFAESTDAPSAVLNDTPASPARTYTPITSDDGGGGAPTRTERRASNTKRITETAAGPSETEAGAIPETPTRAPTETPSSSDCTPTPPRKVHVKKRWSFAEKKIIYEAFGQQFLLKLRPARKEIKTVWEKEPTLKENRTLQQVVTYVNNIVYSKHHISTPIRKKMKNMVARGTKKLSP